MTDRDEPPVDPDDLVAYLDGELDDESAQEVEAKISRSPGARAEADALRRTWELLDYLPKPEPSPSFTHRTLSRLDVLPRSASAATLVRRSRSLGWIGRLMWAAGVLLMFAAGYGGAELAVRKASPPTPLPLAPVDEERLMLSDLRLLENWRLYRHVDDLDFARKLDAPDLFGDDSPER